jgi:hypothetical protein
VYFGTSIRRTACEQRLVRRSRTDGSQRGAERPAFRREVGGGGRSRTADGDFADLCLTTWLRRLGAGALHNDERQTTEHMASVLCLTP